MMSRDFVKEDVEYLMPDSFKGLSKEYLLKCVFDGAIQKSWSPRVGDVIVGYTGNVFVISAHHRGHKTVGGDKYFFAGGLCSRDGGGIMNETYCSVLTKDGLEYKHTGEGIQKVSNPYYSKFSDFRYVPYPHEIKHLL